MFTSEHYLKLSTIVSIFLVGLLSPALAAYGYWVINKADISGYVGGHSSQSSIKKYGIPKLNPKQLFVSSIPVGATVYVVPKDAFEDLFDGSAGSYELSNHKHSQFESESIKKKYFKCSTPCAITINPGTYVVAVKIEVATSRLSDSFILDQAYNMISGSYKITKYDKKGKITDVEIINPNIFKWYLIEKKDYPGILLALFQPKNASLDDISSLYPPGNNFIFEDAALSKSLAEKGVAINEIKKALELLHRGGMIALKGKAGTVIVQITGDNHWKLIEEK